MFEQTKKYCANLRIIGRIILKFEIFWKREGEEKYIKRQSYIYSRMCMRAHMSFITDKRIITLSNILCYIIYCDKKYLNVLK